jgi:hypothetical protein
MSDPTEAARRQLVRLMPQELAEYDGDTWTAETLNNDFEVQGFAAPFVVAVRKSDGVVGTLKFTHEPRVYFAFEEDWVSEARRKGETGE